MIISASRRTDIPAFYSDWFLNRIKEGYVLVRNPMNPRQVGRIDLSPGAVDGIVFWTKNPKPMLDKLERLRAYPFYFQFTLNPYGADVEPFVPGKKEIVETFAELSRRIGKDRVIWRYDPVILSDAFTKAYHFQRFEYLAERLGPHTGKCVFSYVDRYRKTERSMKAIAHTPIEGPDMEEIAAAFAGIAAKYGLTLETCSEAIELEKYGIKHGKCIDDRLISALAGYRLKAEKDPNQRESCGCAKSVDIGAYDTCRHGCRYCYASAGKEKWEKSAGLYDDRSPILCDAIGDKDMVRERKMR